MGANTLLAQLMQLLSIIKGIDPGDGGAIPTDKSAYFDLTTAGAETRTLAAPSSKFQVMVLLCGTYVGDCVITVASAVNAAANNTITLGAAGEFVVLMSFDIAGTLYWRCIKQDTADGLTCLTTV